MKKTHHGRAIRISLKKWKNWASWNWESECLKTGLTTVHEASYSWNIFSRTFHIFFRGLKSGRWEGWGDMNMIDTSACDRTNLVARTPGRILSPSTFLPERTSEHLPPVAPPCRPFHEPTAVWKERREHKNENFTKIINFIYRREILCSLAQIYCPYKVDL